MYLPEYSITSKTLKSIANIEYCKAIIEASTILPHWQKQLEKEARIREITSTLQYLGINTSFEETKRFIDKIEPSTKKEVANFSECLDQITEISKNKDFEEDDFKNLHITLSQDLLPQNKAGVYRSTRIENTTSPEEILAEMTELMDWYNSLDAYESHPIIKAGILKARLETIMPFEKTNFAIANLATLMSLKSNNYNIKDYICLGDFYNQLKFPYNNAIQSVYQNHMDLTRWLEFFTDGLSHELSNIKEKVTLLARDTKVAKASGRVKLSPRQERIIEHLQDYGILQNKDFPKLFPGVSEDSILRDLKALMNEGLIIKTGSTKSSRYELP